MMAANAEPFSSWQQSFNLYKTTRSIGASESILVGGGIGPQESLATEFWMCPRMSCDHSDDTAHAAGYPLPLIP